MSTILHGALEMERDVKIAKFKKGVWLSWLSLLMLPIGLFLGLIGTCAGPENTKEAWVLLGIGVCGFAGAIYGAFRVLRGIRFGGWALRILGALSFCSAILAGYLGWELSAAGLEALKYYLHAGR
jgi:hypothetical protein